MCCFIVVLLLLVAVSLPVRFCFIRVTFNKVHDEACEHQSWHRCQIITEFYSRTSLPAPFNILHGIVAICRFVLIKIGRCCQSCCQVICCRRRQNRHQAHEGDGTALSDIGGATGSAAGGDNVSALGNGDSDQRRPLMGGGELKLMRTPAAT